MSSKASVTKAQNEAHKRILTALMKLEDNRKCADCLGRGPTWASVNLGVFICLNCSGIHRSLGVHNSKVRSTNLDTWLPEQVAFIQRMGNRRANHFWEARLPEGFRRPAEGDMSALSVFIGDKYRSQAYASREYREPPNIDNYTSHPFMATLDSMQEAKPADQPAATSSAPAKAEAPLATRAAAPAPAPVQPPQAMFDLLSMDDAAAPAAATSSGPAAASASGPASDGWAAFAEPQATTASNGAAAAADPADVWDAFQGSEIAAPVTVKPCADDPFASRSAFDDPFASKSSSKPASPSKASANGSTGSFIASFPEAAQPATAAEAKPAAAAPPKKSPEDILKMFDRPASGGGFGGAFAPAGFATGPQQQQQQGVGMLPGYGMPQGYGMQADATMQAQMQASMAHFTPQQLAAMQLQYMQSMGMPFPGVPMPPQQQHQPPAFGGSVQNGFQSAGGVGFASFPAAQPGSEVAAKLAYNNNAGFLPSSTF